MSIAAGRVALGSDRWAIRHTGAGEEAFEQVSSATTVLHRAGALWKLAIAAPWEWGYAGLSSPSASEQSSDRSLRNT